MDAKQLIEMVEKLNRWEMEPIIEKLNSQGRRFWYTAFSGDGRSGDGFPIVAGEYESVRYSTLYNFTWGSDEGEEFIADGAKWVVIARRCYHGSAEPDEVKFLAMKISDENTMDDKAKELVQQASRLMFSDAGKASEWAHKALMMMYEMRA